MYIVCSDANLVVSSHPTDVICKLTDGRVAGARNGYLRARGEGPCDSYLWKLPSPRVPIILHPQVANVEELVWRQSFQSDPSKQGCAKRIDGTGIDGISADQNQRFISNLPVSGGKRKNV